MKLSDFYLSSRHVFAYVAPGALCLVGALLMGKQEPLRLVRASPWGLHLTFFIAGSFVLGFVLQTLVFSTLEKWAPYPKLGKDGDKHPAQEMAPALKRALCADLNFEEIDQERIPKFCRNLALEYGSYARHRILEFENEINLMVALAFSLPILSLGWIIYRDWVGISTWSPAVLTVVYLLFTRKRILEMRQRETGMWCEKYLIVRARKQLVGSGDDC